MSNSDNGGSPPPSPVNRSNSQRPFPPISTLPPIPPLFSSSSSSSASSRDLASLVQNQHQEIRNQHDLLRLHQQQHQAQMSSRYGFSSPAPMLPQLPFLTMPPPSPAIGLRPSQNTRQSSQSQGQSSQSQGQSQSQFMSSFSGGGGVNRQASGLSESYDINFSNDWPTSRPAELLREPQTPEPRRRLPIAPPIPPVLRPSRPTVSVSRGSSERQALGSTQTLGQAPADPHGVRSARFRFPTNPRPSALGGVRMAQFIREQGEERAEPRDRGSYFLDPRRELEQRDVTGPGLVPTSGPLLALMIAALRESHGYNGVATFAKSNYPNLEAKSFEKPWFLQVSPGAILNYRQQPTLVTMHDVLERLIRNHISSLKIVLLSPPDWEGYMLLALELKWLESGLVLYGFGDVVEKIWAAGEDRRGSGEDGRYIEVDVRVRLEEMVWRTVERRFMRGL